VKINLPTIIEVSDYHEFDDIVDILCQFGVDVRYEEQEMSEYYKAIFYEKGNKKSLQKFKKSLEKCKEQVR
jgi:hypothetical protein